MLDGTAISFVVDTNPLFAYQGWHLVHSLKANMGVAAANIHVQFTPEVAQYVRDIFADIGCRVHTLTRFGDGKYCNKLAQWENLRGQGADHILLLDTDMICLADLTELLPRHAVAGKVVDMPNPPTALLDKIFERAGFADRPGLVPVDAVPGDSFRGNCNGGFYSIPTVYADDLVAAWQRHALRLLDDIELLRVAGKENHVDQIAFCLAVHETRVPFEQLPSNANYYSHFAGPHRNFDAARPIALLHYHNALVNMLGVLQPPAGLDRISLQAIAKANDQIRLVFENRLFWDMRYARFPERGSGVGSRGENLAYKRALLRSEGVEQAASVLDIGCGDLQVVSGLNLQGYTGLDRSAQSLALARKLREDWHFLQLPCSEIPSADFVLCLEVAIHQEAETAYRDLIALAAAKTRRTLVISGYEERGAHVGTNHMIFYYEPLSETLRKTGRFASVRKVGAHSDVVIYRCDVD